MEHLGVGEPLGLLDQQTGCCDKLGFGKQRLELAHGTHRSAASRPIAPQPEPAVSPMRYQRAPHSRRIGAVASSPRSWTIASPMPTPPRSSSTMSRRTPSPARHGRAGAADRNRQNRRGQLPFQRPARRRRRVRAASRARGFVALALHLGHDRAAEGRAAPSAPPPSPISHRTSTPAASERSASCPSSTRWGCARCWRWGF